MSFLTESNSPLSGASAYTLSHKHSASVHPPTFSVDCDAYTKVEQEELIWGPSLQERAEVAAMLEDVEPDEKVRERFESCGGGAWIAIHETDNRLTIIGNRCNLRICPRCRRWHRRRLSERIDLAFPEPEPFDLRFITLTLRHSDFDLRSQLSFLRRAFRRLRQSAAWTSTQQYGYAVIELTYNEQHKQWHPHLHVVSRGHYIAHPILKAAWLRASEGSSVVDLRPVIKKEELSHYISKYLGKPPWPRSLEAIPTVLREYYLATRRNHLVIRWGEHPREEEDLTKDPGPTPRPTRINHWCMIAPLLQIIKRAHRADPWAIQLLRDLRTHTPCTVYVAIIPQESRAP